MKQEPKKKASFQMFPDFKSLKGVEGKAEATAEEVLYHRMVTMPDGFHDDESYKEAMSGGYGEQIEEAMKEYAELYASEKVKVIDDKHKTISQVAVNFEQSAYDIKKLYWKSQERVRELEGQEEYLQSLLKSSEQDLIKSNLRIKELEERKQELAIKLGELQTWYTNVASREIYNKAIEECIDIALEITGLSSDELDSLKNKLEKLKG